MYGLVDWISFTVDAPLDKEGSVNYFDPANRNIVRRQALTQVFRVLGRNVMDTLFSSLPPVEGIGRFPYKYSLRDSVSRASVFFDPGLKHILIEVSGIGCKLLQENSLTQAVCALVSTNSTRIDLSVDIGTNAQPDAFVDAGYNVDFRSTTVETSDSGKSIYIGSRKSDRHAVVYRYNPPHPRSDLLRVEHRFKREHAKRMAQYVGEHGIGKALVLCGALYSWRSELWLPEEIGAMPMPDRGVGSRDQNTARWLITQVFPAMRKAEEDGRIPDLRAFLQTYLFDDDSPTDV